MSGFSRPVAAYRIDDPLDALRWCTCHKLSEVLAQCVAIMLGRLTAMRTRTLDDCARGGGMRLRGAPEESGQKPIAGGSVLACWSSTHVAAKGLCRRRRGSEAHARREMDCPVA